MQIFSKRRSQGRPAHPDILTPTEWRVLEQVRAGRTNQEIADQLGVSHNTVKTHVSNMLSKLDVEHRHELAVWQGAPAEASQAVLGRMHLAGPLGWIAERTVSWTGRIVVGAGAVAAGAAFLFAMQSVNESGSPSGGDPTEARTPSPAATSTIASESEPVPLLMPFDGVSTDPRPRSVPNEQRSIGSAPPSPFNQRDADSREVVLYDTQTFNEKALGEGGYTRFSPGGTWLGWIAFTNPPSVMEGELHVIDLASGDERTIGTARSLRWLDDERVIAHVRGNEMAVIDVVTGAYSDPGSLNLNSDPFAEQASGVRLEDMTPEVTGAPPWRRQYRITVPDGTQLDFEAYRARLAPDGMVAFAVVPEDAETDLAWGTPIPGNIYLADPHSLEAEYVGTGLLSYGSWPLDVSEQFVFWTDDSCGLAEGGSRFYDRASGAVTAVDVRLYGEFTLAGLLAVEEFGADYLLDPVAMEYDLALRTGRNVFWSPDYRYAAAGTVPGQGGRCG